MRQRSVFVIGGGGMVGATAAQALAIKEVVHDIVLVDVAEDLVRGQAMDINHATAFTSGVTVRVGGYDEIKEDDIVVIASGAAQKPGQTRLELADINTAIIRDVVGRIMAQGKLVYILMVANPVDVLTYVALKESGLPKERVLGSGTTLDTARLRVAIASKAGVSQSNVHAYILGEHGDSSFPALSNATIAGIPLAAFPGVDPALKGTIAGDIRQAAYKIIEAKKSTYYGIGNVVAKLVEALLRDTASVYPVCSLATGEYGVDGVVLGLPSKVSSRGVEIVDGYPLSASEKQSLLNSAAIVRAAIGRIKQ
ncbi:MAG TPA: L-lactate dehydrogenase [Candidatus Saccharimonadales bacterium]|nr:L-lactate dehydrogenase [Candidatus Saccharimonadales bacterium]